MVDLLTSSDMVQNNNPDTLMNKPTPVEFYPWFCDGNLPEGDYDVGSIAYLVDGACRLELHASGAAQPLVLIFDAPLAIRVVQEGSLMDYWNSGFSVLGHNVFCAGNSEFLSWLERSSGGVHSVDRVKHYAVFTDDICVEVLSTAVPFIQNVDKNR